MGLFSKIFGTNSQRQIKALEGIADQVDIYRAHCLGECQNGPCVRIAGDRFYHIQPDDAPMLVQNEIIPRLNK